MSKIPLLSKGAATGKKFGQRDQKLEAGFVNLDDAKKAEELISERLK